MATARSRQVCLKETPYYHCISRCVRRAFLCGSDKHTGKNYNHRRRWVENRLLILQKVFCIDICAYAVMSNHTHVVLHVDLDKAKELTDHQVLQRWSYCYQSCETVNKLLSGQKLFEHEQFKIKTKANEIRNRLTDISWFMRSLNEYIARKANIEDQCTGRFWEGRFKSQALLDEAALLACMAYVDLNPVRAKEAKSLEGSNFTSIKKRLFHADPDSQPQGLLPFATNQKHRSLQQQFLPISLEAYIDLVKVTGQCIRSDKPGHLPRDCTLLKRLKIKALAWMKMTKGFEHIFHGAVGRSSSKRRFCRALCFKRLSGITSCALLLG